MGKAKKIKLSKKEQALSLGDQIDEFNFATPSGRRKVGRARQSDREEDFIDGSKIVKQARLQVQELLGDSGKGEAAPLAPKLTADDSEEEIEEEVLEFDEQDIPELSDYEQKAFNSFLASETGPRRNLADIIMEKINEKKTEIETEFSQAEAKPEFNSRVVEMYKEVGTVLKRYRSGKVPKAFKVIAQFKHWEDLVILTEPENWSAAAMYQATRIFAANLKEKMTQRFYNCVLLPRIRDDIDTYGRLNFHLYQALRKALFKPGAFFKGFLLPLCESRTCTLREAVIIGSVLAKNSIPVMHSCAALLKIAEMEYSGANSIFLRIFLDKKYALPYRVIDATVFHLLQFRNERRELPVLWHQAFLTFVQRYKKDISSEQKEALLELTKQHSHSGGITQEVRRELNNSVCRDEELDVPINEFL
eukprot:TRINITY_DN18510_c0_g1_i1.p1 TRINITY_DN18510_c0_g1~~TRINITY_DN18510_c0_g1_i1.p1  ORF type:complete len:419 (-),score=137.12 TRINITY_DN18510_c0_g1_i1:32-1288(-)